jgi:hypothetical protein
VKIARDQHGNWYRDGKLVRPLLLPFYFYAIIRVLLAAGAARYLWYLFGKDIPVWYLAGIGIAFLLLLRRIRAPALHRLRAECAATWLEDEVRPTPSIMEALNREMVDAKSAAPLRLPDLKWRS